MKTIFMKSILCVITGIMAITTACKKEGTTDIVPDEPQEVRRVTLSVKSETITAYAMEDTRENTAATFAAPGFVFFLDKDDNIVKRVKLVSTGTHTDDQIVVAPGATSMSVQKVPAIATQVYVLANVNDDFAVKTSGSFNVKTLADIKSFSLDATSIDKQLITAVPMDGLANGPDYSFSEIDNTVSATVKVQPLMARFEIAAVTYDGNAIATGDNAGSIAGFKLLGMFMNSVATKRSFDLAQSIAPADQFFVNSAASFNFSDNSGSYPNNKLIGEIDDADGIAGAIDAQMSKTPAVVGNVWAYHIFPAKSVEMTLPQIVLKIQVTDKGTSGFNPGIYWVTVKNFNSGGSAITQFDRNKLYKINAITFNNNHLSDSPLHSFSNATIDISVENWDTIVTEPNMDPTR